MGPIAKEIKAHYDHWCHKNRWRDTEICSEDPFPEIWMHYYCFPEMLLPKVEKSFMHDEYLDYVFRCENIYFYGDAGVEKETENEIILTEDKYYNSSYTVECLSSKFELERRSYLRRMFPCWLIPEEDIIRILTEIGIME